MSTVALRLLLCVLAAGAVVAGAIGVVDFIGDYRQMKTQLADQQKLLNDVAARQAFNASTQIANDEFDHEIRVQVAQVPSTVSEARKDPAHAAILSTRIPAALRRRVFHNDDPADTSDPAQEPARAGAD